MKLNYKRTFLIGLAFLSISVFWQMYDNIILLILKNTFHMKETMTGVVMASDNVLALFPYTVFFTVLAFICMTQVKHGDAKPAQKKSLLENFDVED